MSVALRCCFINSFVAVGLLFSWEQLLVYLQPFFLGVSTTLFVHAARCRTGNHWLHCGHYGHLLTCCISLPTCCLSTRQHYTYNTLHETYIHTYIHVRVHFFYLLSQHKTAHYTHNTLHETYINTHACARRTSIYTYNSSSSSSRNVSSQFCDCFIVFIRFSRSSCSILINSHFLLYFWWLSSFFGFLAFVFLPILTFPRFRPFLVFFSLDTCSEYMLRLTIRMSC